MGTRNAFVLYDLSSSYMEGRCCPLATLGYSRDGVKGKLQVNYGLICSPEGRPVAVRVHEGNVTDQQTVPDTSPISASGSGSSRSCSSATAG